jgi:dihydroflavonol-4-reductase
VAVSLSDVWLRFLEWALKYARVSVKQAVHRSDFDAVNNEGTCNVLHEAVCAGAARVLHTSTESILVCAQSGDQSVEELRLADENMIGPYCLSKLKGEQEAFRLADSGAPVIVACPTVPIGRGDHNLTPPSRMTLAFCQGKLPAYLNCHLNMTPQIASVVTAPKSIKSLSTRQCSG